MHVLAAFYEQLLGWERVADYGPRPGMPPGDGWIKIQSPDGQGLSFQWEPDYEPPVWPPAPGQPQMMMHLDIGVDDLDAGVARAQELGARLADHQPQSDVRVMLDPAGHPFCMFR